jgi:hypothetical protein
MAYIKGLIAGAAALFAVWVLFAATVVLIVSPFKFHYCCLYHDPRAFVNFYWFISLPVAVLVFAAGFCWEFRRASKSMSPP